MGQACWSDSNVCNGIASNRNLFSWANHIGDSETCIANNPIIKDASYLQKYCIHFIKHLKRKKKIVIRNCERKWESFSISSLPLVPNRTLQVCQFHMKNELQMCVSFDRASFLISWHIEEGQVLSCDSLQEGEGSLICYPIGIRYFLSSYQLNPTPYKELTMIK